MHTTTTPHDDEARSRTRTRRVVKANVAVLAFTAGLVGVSATSAFAGGAGPNDGGTNCHGVWLSYLATSDMSPGQLQKDYGISAQDVQETADIVCGM